VFTRSGAGDIPKKVASVLSWASALLQSPPSVQRPPRPRDLSATSRDDSSSHEVSFPYSVSPHVAAALVTGFASPGRLRPHVFSTSRRLHQPRACRPCFRPDPLLGLYPSELSSSRAAVRRHPAPAPLLALEAIPKDRPRLQGFAPHGSPPLDGRGLTPPPARSSPGLSALQGSLPRCLGAAFAAPPLMGFSSRGANDPRPDPSGYRQQRDRLVSLETSDPPGLRGLVTPHDRSSQSPARESPPRAPGCVTVPCRTFLEPSNRPYRSRS
jgi:hypothetical protein